MSGHAYYAVGGASVAGLWECDEDGAVVYGVTGQVKHDGEHEERERLAAEVERQRKALLSLTSEAGNDLGALAAEVRGLREILLAKVMALGMDVAGLQREAGGLRGHLAEVDDRLAKVKDSLATLGQA